MGAFVTSAETDTVEVPCLCKGTPHGTDTVALRRRFSIADLAAIDGALIKADSTGRTSVDVAASTLKMMELGVVGWSFVDDAGDPIPYSADLVGSLDARIASSLTEALSRRLEEARSPLVKKPARRTGAS